MESAAKPTEAPTAEPTATPKPTKVKISKCKITVKDQTWTGKALKPAVTVKNGKVKLKKGTDYTVSYKNNKAVGTATVTVKGKGNYTGSKKLTFKINPKGLDISKVEARKKSLTVKWKKRKDITGYEVEYSRKKDFKNSETITIGKAKTVSCEIKKLKSNKKYYVRIRAFKKVNKKNYYSAWSEVKTGTTKK